MRFIPTLFLLLLFVACAPKDKPLKGGKNDPNSNSDKILESAYNGSQVDVAAYSTYRLLEAKRILEMALKWVSKIAEKSDYDQKPGFELLKSCWGGKNDVYIDVFRNQPSRLEFALDFDNCSAIGSFNISTKLFGKEFFNIEYSIDSKGNRSLKSIDYHTVNFVHKFKGKDKTPRFKSSSWAELHEQRSLRLVHRQSGEFYFAYHSRGDFEQILKSDSFKLLEPQGIHNYYADGNFIVENHKVNKMVDGRIELNHQANREVILNFGSERSLFTNDRNQIYFMTQVDSDGLSFDKECSFISGKILDIQYKNNNKKRNQFHQKVDSSDKNKTLALSANYVKGRDPEKLIIKNIDGNLVKTLSIKCFQRAKKIKDLAQPKTPFEWLFIK